MANDEIQIDEVLLSEWRNVKIGFRKVERHASTKFFSVRSCSSHSQLRALCGGALYSCADAALIERNDDAGL